MPISTRRLVVPLALGALAVGILSGCVPSSSPTPSDTAATSSPSATPSSTPTPSAVATASAIPITIGCSTLVSGDAMYAFNPNFGLLTSWSPAAGSAAASAQAEKGLACRWQNQTSGDDIDISVAHLDSGSIEALKNAAVAQSTMVPTYGDEAYFSVKNNVGTAIVFQGDYWLVATSVAFLEPGDPSDLINAALSALK